MKVRKKVTDWDAQSASAFVAKHEGCSLEAYRCPAGVWTIGYGLTSVSGMPVHAGMKITQERADELLAAELEKVKGQLAGVVTKPVSQGEFIALVDFVFNVGVGNFLRSTLLKWLNKGEYATAAYEFRRWTFAAGKSLPGLVRRREDEEKLFKEE